MFITLLLLWILGISIVVLLKYVNKRYTYWKDRDIVYEKPDFLLGCMKDFVFGRKSDYGIHREIYNKYPSKPYVGVFNCLTPVLLMRDNDLIKRILTEDFDHFHSRGVTFNPDEVLANNVLFLSGEKWKLLRQKLSATFSSGKIKKMTPLISECGNQLYSLLTIKTKDRETIELRTTVADFTTAVIASCIFGVESNTLTDADTPFRIMGRNLFEDNISMKMALTVENTLPEVVKRLKLSRFRKRDQVFIDIFKNILKHREQIKRTRNDFIDVCLDLKKEGVLVNDYGQSSLEVTDDILAAQAFFFFLAGHDATESTISFALYELTHNKEYLAKAHKEVDQLSSKFDNLLSHDCLEEASYLDKVIKEVMRKYSPIGDLQRVCTEDYEFPDKKLKVEKGVRIIIPAYAIHNDSTLHADPDKFNPERFSDTTTDHSFQYLPFGRGPRHCMGQRLATLIVKTALFTVLKAFTLESTTPYQQRLDLKPIHLELKPVSINDINIVPRQTLQ